MSGHLLAFCKVNGSSLVRDPRTGEVEGILFDVSGLAGPRGEERDPGGEVFAQAGFVSRPLPPYVQSEEGELAPNWKNGEKQEYAESVAVRTSDGLESIATRDNRIRPGGSAPKEGDIGIAGYGGGMIMLSPTLEGGVPISDTLTIYTPFNRDANGKPQNAHFIALDTREGNESVSIIHANGMSVTMIEDALVLRNRHGTASLTLDDKGITMTGQINLAGSVVIGNPSAAVPLAAGAASPPCSTLFVSP